MANTSSIQWMTNFHYGQELRSLYMNGTLNSGFKPGIYNSGMALYVREVKESINPSGIYLYIKKGTTLIFSNRFNKVNDRYERDIMTTGSYIIKCVAFNDIHVPLIELGQTETSTAMKYILGYEDQPASKKFYIVATMLYDESEDQHSDAPMFHLAVDNPLFKNVQKPSSSEEDNNYYFMLTDKYDFRIPDGSMTYSGGESNNLQKFSYLMLGSVIGVSPETQYTDGKDWKPSKASEWVTSHVFMGRGFPDHRQSLTDDVNELAPDMMLSPDLQTFYLDAPSMFERNVIYSSPLDWRKLYKVGTDANGDSYFDIESICKNRLYMYKLDYNVAQSEPVKPYYEPNINYESTPIDMIKDINDKKLIFDSESPEYVLVYDIVFLALREKQTNTDEASLMDIFNNQSNSYKTELKVVPFRGYSKVHDNCFDPARPNEDSTGKFTHKDYNDITGNIIPLDVCETNVNRLKKIVENRSIIPAVVDYIRTHEDESPYLTPEEASSLVPATIAFRKFKVVRDEKSLADYKPVIDLIAVDSISQPAKEVATSMEKKVMAGRVNPANVLSFFDLQFKTSKINQISLTTPDVYGIVPVMN